MESSMIVFDLDQHVLTVYSDAVDYAGGIYMLDDDVDYNFQLSTVHNIPPQFLIQVLKLKELIEQHVS